MSQVITNILTESQIHEFYEQGFVRVNGLFDESEISQMQSACDRVYDIAEGLVSNGQVDEQNSKAKYKGARFTYQPESKDVRHVAWCGNCDSVFDNFGKDERLLQIAGELLQVGEVEQQINQIHYKKPSSAVQFKWHQDAAHRGIAKGNFEDINGKGSYVQIATAIDDVEKEAGPLGFVPGSNKHGYLGELYDANGNFTCKKIDLADALFPLLKRGDVVAFGSYTVHGSKPNIGDKPRRTFINGFSYPGASKKQPALPQEGRKLSTGYQDYKV